MRLEGAYDYVYLPWPKLAAWRKRSRDRDGDRFWGWARPEDVAGVKTVLGYEFGWDRWIHHPFWNLFVVVVGMGMFTGGTGF